ncbi:testis-expressed protein 9 [Diorhabda carinulata]|uniref:testis-expressed protein 9 n=1 Tax=Diorhabda carinulata TaxID=1163345 RepID=UPI0025A068CA|nr:testis-expressed protein 9 [Diorhabda carinulata]XP_057669532.1 testis-expressed protein 9 [Diorhabda carinulata]XP_057669533.1 testis-expressed protein 9 [Diorhabda carinulata]
MESELLKKEDEFYKENEKLEERTKELMKKVNDVMKIQDNLIKESIKMKTDINFAKNNFGDNKNDDAHHSDVYKTGHQITSQDGVEQIGTNGTIQYYKAKFKFLQVEVVKLQTELKNKNEENKKLQIANQSFQEEKEKWFSSYNSSKTRIGKVENQLASLNTRFQEKSTELTLVKKELENTKKDLKNSTLNANSLEIRLTRAQEENDKLKNSLKITKNEEKDIKETFKKQINDLTAIVKLMEKHKVELLNGFKKQMQLIDNLKKQKMYLESWKIGEISESEYLRILNWKFD